MPTLIRKTVEFQLSSSLLEELKNSLPTRKDGTFMSGVLSTYLEALIRQDLNQDNPRVEDHLPPSLAATTTTEEES